MKDIKDYLHLYLGCEVACYSDHLRPQITFERYATLDGIVNDSSRNEHPVKVSFHKEGFKYRSHYCYKFSEVKLLLRPLSYMTEEEAAFIGELVYGKPDSVKWRVEHKGNYLNIYRKHYFKSITIDYASGDIDFYDDGELDTSLQQTEIFRYLLSMDFDLFGLIPAGLAIDKTKHKATV
jgi:hypothetical protein